MLAWLHFLHCCQNTALIWFSLYSHSLKDVQVALSLRGSWKTQNMGMKYYKKAQCWTMSKILKTFLGISRWQLFYCRPLMNGEKLLAIIENELEMNNGRQRYCYTQTTYSLLKEYWYKWLWLSGIKTFLSAHYIKKELTLSEQGLLSI